MDPLQSFASISKHGPSCNTPLHWQMLMNLRNQTDVSAPGEAHGQQWDPPHSNTQRRCRRLPPHLPGPQWPPQTHNHQEEEAL